MESLEELQAKLDSRKLELSKLQHRISKAEKVKRDDSTPRPSLAAAGRLVRQNDNPHSPIWLQDQHFPAQYLVRHTRSMTKRDKALHNNFVVSISIHHYNAVTKQLLVPKLPYPLPVTDFDLPDAMFGQIKLEKLQQTMAMAERDALGCGEISAVWKSSMEEMELKHDCCFNTKLNSGEEAKLFIAVDNIIAVVCSRQYTVWSLLPECNWNYQLHEGECVMCGKALESRVHKVSLLAIGGHLHNCVVRVHIFERVGKFFTVDLVTKRAYESDDLCVWEVTSHWWVASYSKGSVATWMVEITTKSGECVSLCDVPHLSALRHIGGTQHQLIGSTQNASMIIIDSKAGTVVKDISLVCPGSTELDVVPLVVAAKQHKGTLFVVMSYRSQSTSYSSKTVAWLLALAEGQALCKLLRTYQHNSNSSVPHCCKQMDFITTLLNGSSIVIWHFSDSLATQVIFKGNTRVVGYWWLESRILVILDANGNVHRFQITQKP